MNDEGRAEADASRGPAGAATWKVDVTTETFDEASVTVSRSVYVPGTRTEVFHNPSVPSHTGVEERAIGVYIGGLVPAPNSSTYDPKCASAATPVTVTLPDTVVPETGDAISASGAMKSVVVRRMRMATIRLLPVSATYRTELSVLTANPCGALKRVPLNPTGGKRVINRGVVPVR